MQFRDVVRRRRMVRDFLPQPIAPEVLDRILDAGRRAPSAGWSQGAEFLVLVDSAETSRYWNVTFHDDADAGDDGDTRDGVGTRAGFRWQGLFAAPVLIVVWADADRYVARYGEPDKAVSGLGDGIDAWAVPYWLTDAAMAAQSMLLATVDEGLGALFFGLFDHEGAVREEFGVPDRHQAVGAIALGHPAAAASEPASGARSLSRGRRPVAEVIHRGAW